MMTDEERYLRVLDIPKGFPTLAYLTALVKRHLSKIPYENISKIVRFYKVGPSIPNLEEFVSGVTGKSYGGTCFAQNIYLNHILNYIGFSQNLWEFAKTDLFRI